jgi:hypothetical protein
LVVLTDNGFCRYTAGGESVRKNAALGPSLQRGTDMIVDAETFAEIENAVTQATQGLSAATQLVKGLGPQTEEARAYIGRLLNQILEVQIYAQRASAVLDAVKEANQEESSHQ